MVESRFECFLCSLRTVNILLRKVPVAYLAKHVINVAIITRTRNVRACWMMSNIYATCFAEIIVGNALETFYDL